MPIYEFRCTGCGQLFELLLRPGEALEGVFCTHCGREGGERVLSKATHSVGSGGESLPQATSRSCAGGSCSTMTLPGHTR